LTGIKLRSYGGRVISPTIESPIWRGWNSRKRISTVPKTFVRDVGFAVAAGCSDQQRRALPVGRLDDSLTR
jgi:hypothetical protein